MPLTPEQISREKIDAQLIGCGWVIQRYKDYDPSVGRGIALIEVPVKAGTADYLLLVDKQPVGVIEAKKKARLCPASRINPAQRRRPETAEVHTDHIKIMANQANLVD